MLLNASASAGEQALARSNPTTNMFKVLNISRDSIYKKSSLCKAYSAKKLRYGTYQGRILRRFKELQSLADLKQQYNLSELPRSYSEAALNYHASPISDSLSRRLTICAEHASHASNRLFYGCGRSGYEYEFLVVH